MNNETEEKKCVICEKGFPEVSFYTNGRYPQGIPRCKKCQKEYHQPRRAIQKGYKWCPGCEKEIRATTDNFYPCPSRKDKLEPLCKLCCSKSNIRRYAEAKEQREEREKERPLIWICRTCQQKKDFTEKNFSVNVRCHYGLRTTCKQCENKHRKKYMRDHPEKSQARQKKYPYTQRKEYFKERYQQKKDQILAQQQIFKEAFPNIVKAWKDKYKWTERGKLHHRKNSLDYHVRKKGLKGTFTVEDIQDQYRRQRGQCCWCGKKLQKYHIDHIIPITRPGSTNWPDNLVLACAPCNESRGNKLPHEWPQGNHLF